MNTTGPRSISHRVLSSVLAVGARTTWERLLNLASTVFVARLLGPRDIGIASIVLAVTAVAGTIVDGGISTALVRQPEPVTSPQVVAARRFMARVSVAALVAGAASCAAMHELGPLVLLGLVKLATRPLTLWTRVALARRLEFGGVAFADGVGLLGQAAVAVAIATTAGGAVTLVAADVAGAWLSAIYIVTRLSAAVAPPEPSATPVSTVQIVRQGLPYQGFTAVVAARDLVTSAFVGVVVGVRELGILQFAARVLSPVMIVFQSIGQVAIPLGAHVAGDDPQMRAKLRGGFLIAGMSTAVVLATVATPARWLVPMVFGPRWAPAASVVAAIGLALVISGTVNSFGVGLIVAAGRPGVAAAAVASCAAWFMVSMAVMTPYVGGVDAGAWSWVGLAVVEAVVVVTACRRILGVSLQVATFGPALVYAAAYAVGQTAAHAVHGSLTRAVVAAAAAAGVSGCGAALCARRPLLALLNDVRPRRARGDLALGAAR